MINSSKLEEFKWNSLEQVWRTLKMQKLDLKGLLTLTNTWSALPVMSRLIKIQTRISLIRQKMRRNFFDAKLDKNLGNPRKYFKGQNGRYLPKMAEGKAMKWSLTEWKS